MVHRPKKDIQKLQNHQPPQKQLQNDQLAMLSRPGRWKGHGVWIYGPHHAGPGLWAAEPQFFLRKFYRGRVVFDPNKWKWKYENKSGNEQVI